MALVKNLINQAYAQIRVIDDGDEADGVDAAVGVTLLNQILAQANSDQLFPFFQVVLSYPIGVSSQSVTIGAGSAPVADIPALRPEFVNRVLYTAPGGSMPTTLNRLDIPDLLGRSSTVAGAHPSCFAYNAGYPNGTLIFDHPLNGTGTLTIVHMQELPAVDINSDLTTIPPKYDDYLVSALARRLAVRKMRPPEVVANCDSLYEAAKSFIVSSNGRSQVPTLQEWSTKGSLRSNFQNRSTFWG